MLDGLAPIFLDVDHGQVFGLGAARLSMNRSLVLGYFLMPRLRFSMLWVVYTKLGDADPNCIAVCALAEATRRPTTGMVEHLFA